MCLQGHPKILYSFLRKNLQMGNGPEKCKVLLKDAKILYEIVK